MSTLYLLLLFPVVWPFIAKRLWHTEISWREMGLNIGIIAVAVAVVWIGGRGLKASDTEIWNGQVTGKEQVWVSCEHSYECNCRETCSGSGKDRSCSTTCDTCYEHFNDWNWTVRSDVGNFNIARIDRRGSYEPPRWTKVIKGQPVASERTFVNYIKAVPESLFNKNSSVKEQYKGKLPDYPHVYDYHYANRVIPVGVQVADLADWNHKLALALRELGPKKQANAIIVLSGETNSQYAHALEEHWLGGKKNDVVVVLGVPEYPKISWAYVMSWTDRELFKVKLRDALLDQKTLDADKVVTLIDSHVKELFVRKPMKDFEYLWAEVTPPMWINVLAFMIAIFGSMGLTYVFQRRDVNI